MKLRALSLLAVLALLPATEAKAAAWYLGEFGPRALGRGGAVLVNPGDPSAMWLNPAAITNAHGLQLQLDGTLVFMDATFVRDCGPNDNCGPIGVERNYGEGRDYKVTGERDEADGEYVREPNADNLGRFQKPSWFGDGHAVRNQAPFQPVPRIWATLNLDTFGLDGVAVGAGVYAPQAGAYAFGEEEYTRYTLINRDLLEVYYGLTLAYRFQNWIAVGATLQGVSAGVDQTVRMSADLYGNEDPDSDIGVNINVMQHFIPSANFGVWSMPLPGLELGGSIQLGRSVQARGPVALTFGPGVQELIDGGTVAIDADNPTATTAFELPPIYRAGVKYGMQDLWEGLFGFELELDFVYEAWSTYDHIYLETSGIKITTAGNEAPLPPVVQPKDYQDAWSVRLGGEVDFLEDMFALRSGVYYETDAIPNETYSVELLNGQQVGVGVGGSVKLWGVRLDVGYARVFMFDRVIGEESIVHLESAAPPGLGNTEPRTRIAMGRYQTSYDILSVGLNITFDEMFGIGHYAERPSASELPPPLQPAPLPDAAPEQPRSEEPALEQPSLEPPSDDGELESAPLRLL